MILTPVNAVVASFPVPIHTVFLHLATIVRGEVHKCVVCEIVFIQGFQHLPNAPVQLFYLVPVLPMSATTRER